LPTPESAQTIGKYYVDKLYDLEDFLTMGNVEVLPAQEIGEKGKTEERFLLRIIVIIHNLETDIWQFLTHSS